MVVQRVPRVHWEEVDELPASAREAGGFGHTGAAQARGAADDDPAVS